MHQSHLDEYDEHEMTPLIWAVYGGYSEIVGVLLKAGADPNKPSGLGTTHCPLAR